jgi:hypothetical protein
MPVAATNTLSLCLEYLRASIAASATFRTVVGAADEAAALAFIHKFWADERVSGQGIPRAVVGYAGEQAQRQESNTELVSAGPLWVLFEFPTNPLYASDHRDAGTDFTNTIGAIFAEMNAARIARPDLYLNIENYELTGLDHTEQEEATGNTKPSGEGVEDYWWAEFVVYWEG